MEQLLILIFIKTKTMKRNKPHIFICIASLFLMSFSQCSSTKNLQKEVPLAFGEVYCQAWTGGVEAAGSGLNIVIPALESDSKISLDSVYFRGKVTILEQKQVNSKTTYIGRFRSKPPKDFVISNNPKEEYGNTIDLPQNFPFDLKDNECVVSYKEANETKYYKITNVVEKPRNNYPSAPQNLP